MNMLTKYRKEFMSALKEFKSKRTLRMVILFKYLALPNADLKSAFKDI